MRGSIKLMSAAEDLDEDVVVDVDEGDTSDEEVSDAEGEVEDTQEVIDTASDDVDALEDIKDVLEEAADKGEGIDETAAKIVEVAVETIYARMGIVGAKPMGSMESFSNARTRVTATRMAAEGIRDKVSQAWEAIKKFFKGLWDKIKELYNTYLTGLGRTRLKAKKLAEVVARRKMGEAREQEFKDKTLAKAFQGADGKVTFASINKQFTDTKAVFGDIAAARSLIVESLSKPKLSEGEINAIASFIDSFAKPDRAKDFRGADDNATATEYLLGNRAVVFVMDVKGEESKTRIDAYVEDRKFDKDNDGEIKVLSKEETRKICEEVMRTCDLVSEAIKKEKDYDKVLKIIDKEIKENSKSDNKETRDENAKDFRVARELIKVNGKLAYTPKAVAVRGCGLALKLVSRNISMYKQD